MNTSITAMCINYQTSDRFRRIFSIMAVVALVAVMTMSMAFANDPSIAIQQGITKGTEQMYDLLTAIVLPIATVCFAWNAFKAVFGGEKGMEQAKKNLFTIVLVLALVWLAPVAIEQVSGWFEEASAGSGVFKVKTS